MLSIFTGLHTIKNFPSDYENGLIKLQWIMGCASLNWKNERKCKKGLTCRKVSNLQALLLRNSNQMLKMEFNKHLGFTKLQ
jgi:hypothetical protein